MPRRASRVKLDATADLGAEVVLVGPDSAERSRKAVELAEERGYIPVPPYDDEVLMAGQGTIGAEILEDLPDVETVLVPVSGGGLIGGISAAIKLARPEVRVIGVEPELAADARASLKSERLVAEPSGAVTFAAYLFHREELPTSRLTVAVISGGNVEPGLLAEVLSTR